ncbi:unnamed protein product [Calypogeia fissa]
MEEASEQHVDGRWLADGAQHQTSMAAGGRMVAAPNVNSRGRGDGGNTKCQWPRDGGWWQQARGWRQKDVPLSV